MRGHVFTSAMAGACSTGLQESVKLRLWSWCRVCESVATSLVGQKLAGLTGISTAVRGAVEGALTRILTPKRSIDILREVQAAKARGRPYTMVFVGVNGVGKSTNLSKVAYWLLQNNIKVAFQTPGPPSHSAECTHTENS